MAAHQIASLMSAVFRATALAWVEAKYPSSDDEFRRNSANSAADAAAVAANAADVGSANAGTASILQMPAPPKTPMSLLTLPPVLLTLPATL